VQVCKESQSPENGKNLAKYRFDRFSTIGRVRNSLKTRMKKAPQVGLEPTTLRLTEGFHVVAGSCGLLPIHSSFCIYRLFDVAELRKGWLQFAACCVFQTANKRQAWPFFHE